jgi:molybdopterin/thiamine biosynthesis adenylyltransferase
MGGLGSPAALALAAAGIVDLLLIDNDRVDVSNLHRQPLFGPADVGELKAEVAARRLRISFPAVGIETRTLRIDERNVSEVLRGIDFIIDGTDQAQSKFTLNDAAVCAVVPLSHAGAVGWRGQILTILPRRSACLRCLFPEPPLDDDLPTCQTAGVVGGLVASLGALQAAEAIKYLNGQYSDLLADRLLTYDAWSGHWREVRLRRRLDCPLCGESSANAPRLSSTMR